MSASAAIERRLQAIQLHLSPAGTLAVQHMERADTSSGQQSLWQDIPEGPPDAILGVTEAFKKDPSPKKINLGVGAYRTEEGKPLVLNVVHTAEQKIVNRTSEDKEYLGITGNPRFNDLSAKLAFGERSAVIAEKRNATVQALSGTGALRVGAEFLARHYPVHTVLLPSPTWANHTKIFPLAGIADVRTYRYFRAASRDLDFQGSMRMGVSRINAQGMLEDLGEAPEGAIVLLHACAHNPTGVDPSPQQWRDILRTCQRRRLLPFFDSAYQGFASGDLEGDAAAIRLFADAGMEMLLAQSYAKNMGLYGERVGALSVVTKSAEVSKRVESQLKQVIRPMYSSPPRHGAAIVVEILSNPQLYREWREELSSMAGRIKRMRAELYQALQHVGAPGSWRPVTEAIGMFAMLGLSKAQVQHMTKKWHVYLTADSRISMAGLSSASCRYLAEAINDAVRSA